MDRQKKNAWNFKKGIKAKKKKKKKKEKNSNRLTS